MSNLKKLMASATITTALTGGIVGLGEAATTTAASAATGVSAATNVSSSPSVLTGHHRHCRWHRGHGWGHRWGGWGGWHRWGRWGHGHRRHGHFVNRVKIRLNLAENRVRWTHRRGCLHERRGGSWGGWGGW
ncbi:hypothetical protein HII36_48580 [Nonomuraea sp. NN258]|uniref:hypothetical protein n=1 Tax=Nonomuraea antri TaxID=2730852 RepID=UPI0015689B6F|nr:hypothetical protein [Nonomuraea antri]NRQ39636.1 hypothetical protein [Nonomuraea antri]